MIIPTASVALPVVKTLAECADYGRTVAPYLTQLRILPQTVLAHVSSLDDLKTLYASTNPLISSLALSLFFSPIFLLAAEVNKNYSQVDRFWSLLPTFYNLHYAIWARCAGLPTTRVDNVLAFSCLWSLRLTYNYWRKGGYSIGSEDYRWEILRKKISPALFFVFDVLFISTAQNILLWSITNPTYLLLLSSRISPGTEIADLIFSRGLIALVVFEYFADGSQWNYQQAKKEYKSSGRIIGDYNKEDFDRGFHASGLFAWSRHPNFAAEQTIWMTLYAWAAYITKTPLNWTVAGAISYLILFYTSTLFTESISSAKYAQYKDYQRRVGKFIPKLFGGYENKLADKTNPYKPGILKRAERSVQEEVTKQ